MMFIIALAVVATACNNPQNQQNTEDPATMQSAETIEQTTDLFGKEWKLTALNGETIVLDSTFNAESHLTFDQENNRVAGNGGCNSFGGNLELKGNDDLEISDVIATQMACPNLDIEQRFFEALRNAKHYHINGNTLTLYNDNHEGVATLQLNDSE